MTDLHCHILHNIDDGPSTVEQSLDLIRLAAKNSINKIVLTPHLLKYDSINAFISLRDDRIKELKKLISLNEIDVEIFPGAEVYINDDIFYTNDLEKLTINGSRYILTEFACANLNEKRLIKYIDELLTQGLTPIIAHPERYQYFQHDHELIRYIAQMGAFFQVNADALCGLTGRTEARLAKELVMSGRASIIATDAHSAAYRPNNLMEMINVYLEDIDSDIINRLVNSNPEAVIFGNNME